jgi:hypothetical protein
MWLSEAAPALSGVDHRCASVTSTVVCRTGGAMLEKYRGMGMEEVAPGNWPEGESCLGMSTTCRIRRGVIVELISRIPRK